MSIVIIMGNFRGEGGTIFHYFHNWSNSHEIYTPQNLPQQGVASAIVESHEI